MTQTYKLTKKFERSQVLLRFIFLISTLFRPLLPLTVSYCNVQSINYPLKCIFSFSFPPHLSYFLSLRLHPQHEYRSARSHSSWPRPGRAQVRKPSARAQVRHPSPRRCEHGRVSRRTWHGGAGHGGQVHQLHVLATGLGEAARPR